MSEESQDAIRKMIVQSMCSDAADAYVTQKIEWYEKTITVSMTTSSGKPFFSDAALRHVVGSLKRDAGIDLRDRDSEMVTGQPQRSDWTLMVVIGDAHYRARLIDQPHLKTNTLELQPVEDTNGLGRIAGDIDR